LGALCWCQFWLQADQDNIVQYVLWVNRQRETHLLPLDIYISSCCYI